MDIFAFNPASFISFLMTFMRVSLVIFLMPFYGGEYIPPQVKAALCLVLSLALWPHLSFPAELAPTSSGGIVVMMLGEAILGLMLGLCVYFIFAAIQTGGQIIGFQMGFTMVTLADPDSGSQVSISSHLLYTVALIVFLALDGHLHLLRGLADSFTLIPPGGLRLTGALTSGMLEMSANMFTLAVRIAAPVLAALFMAELALALMGRAAPQMNLLTMGFPIKIAAGFFFMGILFTTMSLSMEEMVLDLGPMFRRIMEVAR
jgi:flagellar biosynthetic protein FliR